MTTSTDKSAHVQAMFSRIVRRYDLMNRVMTLGRDQAWRRLTARELHLDGAAPLVLDLATGTGDIALAIARAYPSARVIALDFARPMLDAAQDKSFRQGAPVRDFAQGDALRLPFADAVFDALTNGFLLRNVADLRQALAEMRRVVKPGGQVACLEITRPGAPIFRDAFRLYFYGLVPRIGRLVSGDPQAYTYLPHSLTHFPRASELSQMMLEVGFRDVRFRLLGLGAMALHIATV
ncbi:MAG: ubiquinone/menaquinone biosynthesis methyltransferase [Anaerolineae bacterium]|nr:ubiquinone/menaquinone biosynthesis methyltransferase [Thermoflexales bacterium]MDW8407247.1 ubiquinone/menaquinone biosynthesis methyltransferase [Anaerolineae bacterium]